MRNERPTAPSVVLADYPESSTSETNPRFQIQETDRRSQNSEDTKLRNERDQLKNKVVNLESRVEQLNTTVVKLTDKVDQLMQILVAQNQLHPNQVGGQ